MNNNDLNSLQIKIIDFGMVEKINFPTKYIFGTKFCYPNDWLLNSTTSKETILQPHHDFFELGITILEILHNFKLFKRDINMFCPINSDEQILVMLRTQYNLDQHKEDMKTIKDALLERLETEQEQSANIDIIVDELLFKMVHPNPEKRINSVNDLLAIVNTIE
jgi:serine/threonine protein kinase